MATPIALMLAFSPFTNESSPVALGLGHEFLIQTETTCGSFCLGASNAQFDSTFNANFSQAQVPQAQPTQEATLTVQPIQVRTFDVGWHPFNDVVLGVGFRTTTRSAERKNSNKVAKRLSASTREIPVSAAIRPGESFSVGGRLILRNVELQQSEPANFGAKSSTFSASPLRWSVDALWQKSDATGFGVSYTAPTIKKMTGGTPALSATTPQWTDPQEFTFSMAHFTSMRAPDGITFGPFENTFHASLSTVTWESGKPVTYAALASSAASKDGWSLTDTSGQTQEFIFDTLEPSLSASAGLESVWMRSALGHLSTYTHVRLNHLATRKDSTAWQGGFGLGFSTRYVMVQASTIWRDQDSGYAFGLSSSL